jgi:hypothetical protein
MVRVTLGLAALVLAPLQPAASTEAGFDTARLTLRAGPDGGATSAHLIIHFDLEGRDIDAGGFTSSLQDWVSVTMSHQLPNAGRVAAGTESGDVDMPIASGTGSSTNTLRWNQPLAPNEVITTFISYPDRRILDVELVDDPDSNVDASFSLHSGAEAIYLDEAGGGGGGAVAGPAGGGISLVERSFDKAVIGTSGWADCVGSCTFLRIEPEGRELSTEATGDPINGRRAYGDAPDFIGPGGSWAFFWMGALASDPWVGVSPHYRPALAEPAAFVVIPAEGLITSAGTW